MEKRSVGFAGYITPILLKLSSEVYSHMPKNKHIAMWSCSRSRSTVMAHAFEQLEECLLLDSPFYASYVFHQGISLDSPYRQQIIDNFETDYKQVIEKMIGDLPEEYTFSFQRHIARTALPQFGRNWLQFLNNFFLIRHPKEIILSWQEVQKRFGRFEEITSQDIGIDVLYSLFSDVKSITGNVPLVIKSTDLAKNPRQVLEFLCNHFEIPFSEKMLTWEQGLKNSKFLPDTLSPTTSQDWSKNWYSFIANSTGFTPYKEKQIELPNELIPLLELCLPFYEKLLAHAINFDNTTYQSDNCS